MDILRSHELPRLSPVKMRSSSTTPADEEEEEDENTSDNSDDSKNEVSPTKHFLKSAADTRRSRPRVPLAVAVVLLLLVVGLSITCIVLISKIHAFHSHGTPTILFLGDSNTEWASIPEVMGWQVLFTQDYVRRADVINRGAAGWTTKMWLSVLPALLDEWATKPPVLTAIFLGSNDASAMSSLHLPISDYEANVVELVSRFQASWQTRILLITPPPVDDNSHAWKGIFVNADVGLYAAAMRAVADRLHVPVVDLWTSLQPSISTILSDGVHLTREGCLAVHDLIRQGIADAYPDLVPSNMPRQYTSGGL
ncbi:Aste57867_8236 [Aphanomyces stellatus]|uniref:Aste57867_8236 protein n=1 Tax=Aphanomyces stellatus TaxID=120398 RepID=A0A485KJU0_9STRA|nr:hypothetical protein As57867_008205 [Aphanomyces stellatus]VFT85123.1 Aste57867_8236 [Aphanomyces stellatus]